MSEESSIPVDADGNPLARGDQGFLNAADDPADGLESPESPITEPTDEQPPVAEPEPEPELQTEPEPEPEVEPDPKDAKASRPSGRVYKEARESKRRADDLQRQLDEQKAQYDADKRAWEAEKQLRAQEQARVQEAQAALSGQAKGTPGVDRPFTMQELAELEQNDPLEFSRVTSRLAVQEVQNLRQQIDGLRQQQELQNEFTTYRQSHTDYDNAEKYIAEREAQRFRAVGVPDVTQPHQPHPSFRCCVAHAVQSRAMEAVMMARQLGKAVPQLIEEYAVADGWQRPEAAPQPAPAASNGNGHAEQTPQQRVAASKRRAELAESTVGNIPSSPPRSKRLPTRADVMRDDFDEAQIEAMEKEHGANFWDKMEAE